MATPFNLVAQLHIQGPVNLSAVVRRVQTALSSITCNVNITLGGVTTSRLTAMNTQLSTMSTNLANITTNATAAAAALSAMASALASARSGSGPTININNNLGAVSRSARVAANDMEEFGRISALAVRRFAAFSIPAGFIIGAVTGMKQAVSQAIEYDIQMNRLQQTTMASKETLRELSAEISRLATGMGVSSKSLSEVSVTLASAGYSAKEVKTALEALAQTQLGSQFEDIKVTTDGAIAAMQQFKLGAGDLQRVFGEMTAVARGFAVESRDIVSAIQHTGGAFSAAGGNLEELMALFTAVRATTRESADSIATGLRTIFTRIQRPQTIEFMRQMGVELQDLNGMFVGPYESIKRLSEAMKNLDTRDIRYSAVVEQLGGYRQVSKVIPLLQEFGVAQKALSTAQAGSNAMAQEAAIRQEALATKLIKVREAWLQLGREVVDSKGFRALAESAMTFATAMTQVMRSLQPVLPLLITLGSIKALSGIHHVGKGFGMGLKFASGGVVPGYGSGDTVPAMLTPGEFVVRKSAVQAIGAEKLHAMNAQKFAIGGPARLNVINAGPQQHDVEGVANYALKPEYTKLVKANTNESVSGAINKSGKEIVAGDKKASGTSPLLFDTFKGKVDNINSIYGIVLENVISHLYTAKSPRARFSGAGQRPGDFLGGVPQELERLLENPSGFQGGLPTEIKMRHKSKSSADWGKITAGALSEATVMSKLSPGFRQQFIERAIESPNRKVAFSSLDPQEQAERLSVFDEKQMAIYQSDPTTITRAKDRRKKITERNNVLKLLGRDLKWAFGGLVPQRFAAGSSGPVKPRILTTSTKVPAAIAENFTVGITHPAFAEELENVEAEIQAMAARLAANVAKKIGHNQPLQKYTPDKTHIGTIKGLMFEAVWQALGAQLTDKRNQTADAAFGLPRDAASRGIQQTVMGGVATTGDAGGVFSPRIPGEIVPVEFKHSLENEAKKIEETQSKFAQAKLAQSVRSSGATPEDLYLGLSPEARKMLHANVRNAKTLERFVSKHIGATLLKETGMSKEALTALYGPISRGETIAATGIDKSRPVLGVVSKDLVGSDKAVKSILTAATSGNYGPIKLHLVHGPAGSGKSTYTNQLGAIPITGPNMLKTVTDLYYESAASKAENLKDVLSGVKSTGGTIRSFDLSEEMLQQRRAQRIENIRAGKQLDNDPRTLDAIERANAYGSTSISPEVRAMLQAHGATFVSGNINQIARNRPNVAGQNRAAVFDFDKTLANPLGSGQHTADIANAVPISKYVDMARKAQESGRQVYILTARRSVQAGAILEFANNQGLKISPDNIIGVGDMYAGQKEPGVRPGTMRNLQDSTKKGLVLQELAKKHAMITFFDDDAANVAAANQVGKNVRGRVTRLATGGYIGSDTVPALLTPGEFVMSKEAVQKVGVSTMNHINKFAAGGPVGFASGGIANMGSGAMGNMLGVGMFSGMVQGIFGMESGIGKFTQALTGLIMTIEGTRAAMGMLQGSFGNLFAASSSRSPYLRPVGRAEVNTALVEASIAPRLASRAAADRARAMAERTANLGADTPLSLMLDERATKYEQRASRAPSMAAARQLRNARIAGIGTSFGTAIAGGALVYAGSLYEESANKKLQDEYAKSNFSKNVESSVLQDKKTSSTLSNVGGGVAIGASIGFMVGGPIGAAVGAAAGGLVGFGKALYDQKKVVEETTKAMRDMKFAHYEQAGKEAISRLQSNKSFNLATDTDLARNALSEQLKALREIPAGSADYKAKNDALASQVGAYEYFKDKIIQGMDSSFLMPGTKKLDTTKAMNTFGGSFGGMGNDIINIYARSHNTGIAQVQASIAKEIEARINNAEAIRKASFAVQQFGETLRSIERFGQYLQLANNELEQSAQRMTAYSSVAGGQFVNINPIASTTIAQAGTDASLISTDKLRSDLSEVFSGAGVFGGRMTEDTMNVTNIMRDLPNILREVRTGAQDMETGLKHRLDAYGGGNNQFANMVLMQFGATMGTTGARGGDPEMRRNIQEDAGKVAQQLGGGFGERWLKAVSEVEKQLIDGGRKMAEASKLYAEAQLETTRQQVSIASNVANNARTIAGMKLTGTGLTLEHSQLTAGFHASMQAQLAGTGVAGVGTDVAAISNRLSAVNTELSGNKLLTGLGSKDPTVKKEATLRQNELYVEQNRLVGALRKLADSTELVTAAQQKFTEATQGKETRNKFLEGYVFGGIDNKINTISGIQAAGMMAQRPEFLRYMPEQMTNNMMGFANQFENVALPIFGQEMVNGKMTTRTGRMFKDNMMAAYLDQVALPPEIQQQVQGQGKNWKTVGDAYREQVQTVNLSPEQQKYLKELEAVQDKQVKAQETLLQMQITQQEKMNTTFISALEKFANDFATLFGQMRLDEAQKQFTNIKTSATGLTDQMQTARGLEDDVYAKFGSGAFGGMQRGSAESIDKARRIAQSLSDNKEDLDRIGTFQGLQNISVPNIGLKTRRDFAGKGLGQAGYAAAMALTDAERIAFEGSLSADELASAKMGTTKANVGLVKGRIDKVLPPELKKAIDNLSPALGADKLESMYKELADVSKVKAMGRMGNGPTNYELSVNADKAEQIVAKYMKEFRTSGELEKEKVMKRTMTSAGLDPEDAGLRNTLLDISKNVNEIDPFVEKLKTLVDFSYEKAGRELDKLNQSLSQIVVPLGGIDTAKVEAFRAAVQQFSSMEIAGRGQREQVGVEPAAPLALGGNIFKPSGTDTVPAMLTPGEFVVRRDMAEKHRDILQAINNNQYLAGGGDVKTRAEILAENRARYQAEMQRRRDDFAANQTPFATRTATKKKEENLSFDTGTLDFFERRGETTDTIKELNVKQRRLLVASDKEEAKQKLLIEKMKKNVIKSSGARRTQESIDDEISRRTAIITNSSETRIDDMRRRAMGDFADTAALNVREVQRAIEAGELGAVEGEERLAKAKSKAIREGIAVGRDVSAFTASQKTAGQKMVWDATTGSMQPENVVGPQQKREKGIYVDGVRYADMAAYRAAKNQGLAQPQALRNKSDETFAEWQKRNAERVAARDKKFEEEKAERAFRKEHGPLGKLIVPSGPVQTSIENLERQAQNVAKYGWVGASGKMRLPDGRLGTAIPQKVPTGRGMKPFHAGVDDVEKLVARDALGNTVTGKEEIAGIRSVMDTKTRMKQAQARAKKLAENAEAHGTRMPKVADYYSPTERVRREKTNEYGRTETYYEDVASKVPMDMAYQQDVKNMQEYQARETAKSAIRETMGKGGAWRQAAQAWKDEGRTIDDARRRNLHDIGMISIDAGNPNPRSTRAQNVDLRLREKELEERKRQPAFRPRFPGSAYADGGWVRGYAGGGSVDGVPAMLSPGEFVLNRAAVQRVGADNLQKFNQGGLVQYRAGGGDIVGGSGSVVGLSNAAEAAMQTLSEAMISSATSMKDAMSVDPFKKVFDDASNKINGSAELMTKAASDFKAFADSVAGIPKQIDVKVNNIDALSSQVGNLNGLFGQFEQSTSAFVAKLDGVVSRMSEVAGQLSGLVGSLKDKLEVNVSVNHGTLAVTIDGKVTTDEKTIRQIALEAIAPEIDNFRRRLRDNGTGIS